MRLLSVKYMVDCTRLWTLIRQRIAALFGGVGYHGRYPQQNPFRYFQRFHAPCQSCTLSVDQKEIADRIWHEQFRVGIGPPDYAQVIHVALEHLQHELYSDRGPDVLEEIRREIDYRLWCDDVVQRK